MRNGIMERKEGDLYAGTVKNSVQADDAVYPEQGRLRADEYTLADLVNAQLVHEEVYPDYRYYALTEEGRTTLEALRSSLAASIRNDIDEYLRKNRLEFREAVSVRSEYYRTTEGDYAVRCRVMEHSTALIDMTLTVPNETQAKIVSKEWKEKSQEIYAHVMRTLTQPEHIDRLLEDE